MKPDVGAPTGDTAPPVVESPPAVEEAPAAPTVLWTPDFDDTDDLSGLLRADSPLLARAFGGVDRTRRRKRS